MLLTTAVTISTLRSTSIGSENALAPKVKPANNDPTALPTARNGGRRDHWYSPATGKKTWIIDAARAQTRNMTINTSAKTIALERWRRPDTMHRETVGVSSAPIAD